MADAFAPQLSSEVRFNQPVETPSTLGTLAGLASTFVGSFADAQRGGSRASSGVDPNLAVFQQGLERVEAIRQEKGEAAAQIVERRLAANFAAQGISFGQDYEDVYTKTTGRPWAGYGMDVEANMLQEALKDSQVQASYIASFAINKDWNEEQRIEYAIGQKAQMTAMENEITRSKTEANYKWTTQSESAYTGAVDTFVNTTFGAMSTAVMSGGRVGPQDIANVQAQWAQLKMNLTRPAGISDDQWKAVQDKFDAVDNTLTAMEKAGSNEVLLNEITSAFARQILDAGDGSPESALAAMTAMKDPASLANLKGMGPKIIEFLNTIGKAEPLNIASTDLFGHIVSDGGGVSPTTDPNAFLNDIPSEAKARVEGKTPQQIYDGLEASGQLTAIIRPNDLNRIEAREQFTENAAAIGMVMQGTGNDKFLSNDFLKKLVANPGFIRNIQTLDTLDPEAATVARTYVRSGLNVELNKQQRNLEAIESSLGVRWNGNAYVLDRQGLMDKNGWTEQQADGFIAWVGRTYGGDLKRLADGTTPMPPGMNFQPGGLQQAYDRRAAIDTINQTMEALAVPVEEGQQGTPVGSVTAQLLDRFEGGGDYDALFGFANREGGPFAGTKVSEMTIGELKNFANGEYADYSRERLGYKATPMGRFQFVGTTLASVAKRMGLSDDTVFSPEVQNQMFIFHAKEVMAGKSQAGKRTAMRDTWEGLQNASNAELDKMIAEIEGGNASFGTTGVTGGSFRASRPSDANAVAAASAGAIQRAVEGSPAPATQAPMAAPEAAPVEAPMAGEAVLPEELQQQEATPEAPRREALQNAPVVDRDVAALIREISSNPDKTYDSEEAFLAAVNLRGELQPGDTAVVNGVVYIIRRDGTPSRLGPVEE